MHAQQNIKTVSRDYQNTLPVMCLDNISRFGLSRPDAMLFTVTYNGNILLVA